LLCTLSVIAFNFLLLFLPLTLSFLFFFNDPAPTEIYTLSLHDALPIYGERDENGAHLVDLQQHILLGLHDVSFVQQETAREGRRSEEHTSELQSRGHLVCRLLLEKKKKKTQKTKLKKNNKIKT